MKYMNNHYGQSRIFGKARFKFPMQLQFFAESEGGEPAVDTPDGGSSSAPEEPKLSHEQLLEKLAEAETRALKSQADADKWKAAHDKTSSELANTKKQLSARMTAEEQADAAKKEAEDAKDARIAELESREKVRDFTELLMDKDIGMEKKEAKELAQMLVDGDLEKSLSILGKHIKAIKDSAYQQALKDRPDIAAGHGTADKKSLAAELAVKSAKKNTTADTAILKNYIVGGF